MTKKFISIFCAFVAVLTMANSAFAYDSTETENSTSQEVIVESEEASVTRAYEYEWRYIAANDGYLYLCLWNITLARWEGERIGPL